MNYTHCMLLVFIVVLSACKPMYMVSDNEAKIYKISQADVDSVSEIAQLLKPYRDSLSLIMNEVIGQSKGNFKKEKPGGSLGNLVADAMFFKAKKINPATQNAICNYGGIRINEIRSGDITRGKIFELLPFENELVILELNGTQLKQWIEVMAKSDGWPIATYLPMNLPKLKQALAYQDSFTVFDPRTATSKDSIITFSPLADDVMYTIATNDYIANGGDQCDFLKTCKRINTGLLIRDVMIEYIQTHSYCFPNPTQRVHIVK